ncbi:acetate kinase [Roseiarcus fermentans]|uniref:Acetate kinase n=1 Tax=Roseiarcus fermentans TaxID=1473586 RepID=A0A366FC31_9HYPH|nr:acetate/propionate family kinase [Roseiarcus fermentans]RBP12244.1 acetate kinase [Roseiarcus fermentans]
MSKIVLTFNAGSSSLKFAAFGADNGVLNHLAAGQVEGIGATPKGSVKRATGEKTEFAFGPGAGGLDHRAAMKVILGWLTDIGYARGIVAVGHRVVHGGPDLVQPILIDEAAIAKLQKLIPLAPLHQPHNLSGIAAAIEAFPGTPQVACFDTAFHRSHPFVSDTFALPRSYYDEGVRRYGFHGLSYEYILRTLKKMAPQIAREDVIVAHLGNGASMCAVKNGRSIASTMGFTALDGLPMGTRCGQLDPGVLLYLMAEKKMDAQQISDLLYKESGLKGMSGLSQDMRELEASDSPRAKEAIDYFVHRIRRELAGLAATVDGVEGVVFTGGIGEHSARIRKAVLTGMEWMGLVLDDEANEASAQIISAKASPTAIFVIPTDEERMIARHTLEVTGDRPAT